MSLLAESVAEQYDRLWNIARGIFADFSEERWKSGERPELTPARWALHLVETADFYARETRGDFRFGHRFGVDWEADTDRLPDRDSVLIYLEEIRAKTNQWLLSAGDDLLKPETAFPWCGKLVLNRALYLMRHTEQHLGELGMLLRIDGAEEVLWR